MSRGDFGRDFHDFNQTNATYNSGNQYSSSNEYQKLSAQISKNIENIERRTNAILNIEVQDHDYEQKIKDLKKLLQDTSAEFRILNQIKSSNSMEATQRDLQTRKLHDRLLKATKNFQNMQRQSAEKAKANVERARTASQSQDHDRRRDDSFGESTGGQSLQVQEEMDVQLEEVREREEALRRLESDIVDVNEIFKDLAIMVHEQGETIDCIEANIESTAQHVESGNEQLVKAKQHQKAARKKKCCLLVILLVAAAVLGIIIYISVRN